MAKGKMIEAFIKSIYDNKGSKEAKKDLQDIKNTGKETNNVMSKLFNAGKIGLFAKGLSSAAGKIGELSKKSSDYIEVLNVLDVAFDSDTDSIRKFTSAISDTLNLDEASIIKMAGAFKTLANSLGYSNEVGGEFAELMTKVTLDASSLYNMSLDKSRSMLQSAIMGRGQSLAKTGANVLESTVQGILDKLNIDAEIESMNGAEKAMARTIAIIYQLQNAQGDLARTIEAPANQFRVFGEQIAQVGRNIGNVFLPMVAAVLPYLNGLLIVLNKLIASLASLVGFDEKAWDNYEGSTKSIASAFDDLGASVGGVGSAAKETRKQLMGLRGFDKLNVIKTPTPTSGSGGAGGGGINKNLLDALNKLAANYDFGLDGVETKATRIANAIMNWGKSLLEFDSGNINSKFQSIYESVQLIGKSINDIFSNQNLQASVGKFFDNFVQYIKTYVSTLFEVGVSLADGLLGGFASFIDEHKESITNDFINLFDTLSEYFKSASSIFDNVGDILGETFSSDAFKSIMQGLFTSLYETTSQMGLISLNIGTELLKGIEKVISDNKDNILKTIGTITIPISYVIKGQANGLTNFFDSFWGTWNDTIKPTFKDLFSTISDIVGVVLKAWNENISPLLDEIGSYVGNIYQKYIYPIAADLIDIISNIAQIIVKVWKNQIKPQIDIIMNVVLPLLIPPIEKLLTIVKYVANNIFIAIKTITGVLSGLIEFVSGAFSGDWDKAFKGVQKVIDTLKNFIKDKIDNIIGFFNGLNRTIETVFKGIGKTIQGGINLIGTQINRIKDFFSNAFEGAKRIWSKFPNWFRDIFSDAWSKVKAVFSTGGKVFSGIKEGIEKTFKSIVNKLIDGINKIITEPFKKINSMLNKIRNVGVMGVKPFKGLWGKDPISIPKIPKLEKGGIPQVGQMFIAREKGPELVANISGHTTVMNNDQIVSSVSSGVAQAVRNVMGNTNNGGVYNIYLDKDHKLGTYTLEQLQGMAKSNGRPITIG